MKGSLIIIAFFVLGIICGHQYLLPDSLNVADLNFYALCALMFFVGISVGCDPTADDHRRHAGRMPCRLTTAAPPQCG